MRVHDLSGGDDVLAHVETVARRALRHYDVAPDADVRLVNVSENATFTVDGGGVRTILRVHRLGYHSPQAIASELDWAQALRREAGVRTPRVIHARDGSRIVTVESPGADTRQCVMFEFLPGGEPPQERLVEDFEPLGAITARMHLHARGWARPPEFTRFHWDLDAAFGPFPRWGSWRDGPGMDAEARVVLARLEARVRDRLRRFGTGPERYGLIHADLRLANLLVDEEAGTSVIDFDDCGMGWYLYDFGAAVSFMEHDPRVPEMIASWVRGYRSVADLPRADEDEVWTFVMFRRLLLVGWIGSHSAADIARELGAGYTRGTCELAEHYLATP